LQTVAEHCSSFLEQNNGIIALRINIEIVEGEGITEERDSERFQQRSQVGNFSSRKAKKSLEGDQKPK
jgi:hypothetical protein